MLFNVRRLTYVLSNVRRLAGVLCNVRRLSGVLYNVRRHAGVLCNVRRLSGVQVHTRAGGQVTAVHPDVQVFAACALRQTAIIKEITCNVWIRRQKTELSINAQHGKAGRKTSINHK